MPDWWRDNWIRGGGVWRERGTGRFYEDSDRARRRKRARRLRKVLRKLEQVKHTSKGVESPNLRAQE